MSVAELTRAVEALGMVPRGRASKSISDALYREIGKGRVTKVRRAVYRADHIPKVTLWRVRNHVRQLEVLAGSTLRRQPQQPAA